MPVLGEVTIIMVRGEDWLAADEADQHQYELTSGELGIVLVKEGGNAQDVLEVVREPNRSRSVEVVSYDGGVGCSRAAWEHALCRILGLPDPCFRRGVNGASGSVVEVPIPEDHPAFCNEDSTPGRRAGRGSARLGQILRQAGER